MPDVILTKPRPFEPVRIDAAQFNGVTSIETIRFAVHEARAALAVLLDAAGVDSGKTRESARLLNVNRGLIWRVSRAVGAVDDVTAATNLPGNVGLERLLEACRAKGVGEDVIMIARAAVRAFHEVAQALSVDRRTLEILLANSGTQSTSLDLESARRAMFEGGCAVWGVRAEVRLRCMFLAPNAADPTMLDEAGVAGYVGFRRLRQVPWPMSYKAAYRESGEMDTPLEELIDQEGAGESSLPLLRDFCVPRELNIKMVTTGRATRHELPVAPDAGSQSTTCVFGSIHRRIYPAISSPGCRLAGAILVMDTPVERVIFDTFVHRSLGMNGPPEMALVDRLTRPHGYSAEDLESEKLPIESVPRRLGPGSAGAVTSHIPWYPRMLETVCKRMGYRSEEFIAHRVEMVYPPIPTAMIVQYLLPGQAD